MSKTYGLSCLGSHEMVVWQLRRQW